MSESVAERNDPMGSNLTYLKDSNSNYQTMDYDYNDRNSTDKMDYVNPFTVPAVRITFIFLYSLVFACCFFGEFYQICN